jgi:hypothetical protein
MKIRLIVLFILIGYFQVQACSMYKITLYGKTFVGNNEDYWNPNTRVWFEKGNANGYGSVFVGLDNLFPQGGMNEKGLMFDGFSVNQRAIKRKVNKLTFYTDITKDVMRKCQNVDEVYNILLKYDLSPMNGSMLLFIDKIGNYLIIEADTMIKGRDDKYLLSNFCPSKTPVLDSVKIPFYQNGRKMLEAGVDTSLSYLTSLSDTLHQNWKNLGGTLYTTIYDLNAGVVYLYLFHDYKHQVKLNLKEELEKGDRILEISSLFPPNKNYEKLRNYKTPYNSSAVLCFLVFCGGLFLFSSVFFLFSFFRGRKMVSDAYNKSSKVKLILFIVDLVLVYFVFVLLQNELIYYFPLHFKAIYIPFLILILIVPLFKWNLKFHKEHTWPNFLNGLFALNNISYAGLIILFSYWLSYHFLQ